MTTSKGVQWRNRPLGTSTFHWSSYPYQDDNNDNKLQALTTVALEGNNTVAFEIIAACLFLDPDVIAQFQFWALHLHTPG